MFSANKPHESDPQPSSPPSDTITGANCAAAAPAPAPTTAAPRPKATPSVLSADLTIFGNIKTLGDIQVEGIVEGDIRAAHLTVGQTATIRGEVVAEEVVVNGRVVGRLRGLKVRLSK